jgi:hypothetical protein
MLVLIEKQQTSTHKNIEDVLNHLDCEVTIQDDNYKIYLRGRRLDIALPIKYFKNRTEAKQFFASNCCLTFNNFLQDNHIKLINLN